MSFDETAYLKPCRYCGQLIRMATVPSGTWQPFDIDGQGRHECGSDPTSNADWSLRQLGHRLTCRMDCWWCGDRVYFHTNGNGGCVLFDELGWPWNVHDCWKQHTAEHESAVDHVEGVLRSHGYTGRGEHINVRPSAVPKRIPLKGAKNPPALRIKLTALDHTLLDDATQKIVRIIKEKSRRAPVAYPLPVQKPETKEESQLRHRRVVAIWDVPPSLIQQLTAIQLPSGIDVTIQQAKRRSN